MKFDKEAFELLEKLMTSSLLYRLLKHLACRVLSTNCQEVLRKELTYWQIKRGNYTVEPEMGILSLIIRKGATVLDIGANVGKYTRILSTIVGSKGMVLAFEPIPKTYEKLSSIARKLKWTNVVTYRLALSDDNSEHQMNVPLDDKGVETLGLAYLQGNDKNEIDCTKYVVQTRCLDDLALDLKQLDFVKCDVEGAELKVFRGAERILRQFRPIILVEIEDRHLKKYGLNLESIFKYLYSFGYRSYYYDGKTMVSCTCANKDHFNYLFATKEKKETIEAIKG